MRKLYVPESHPSVRTLPLLAPARSDDNRLFQHLSFEEYKDCFLPVADIADAEAVLLPHYLPDIRVRTAYLEQIRVQAKEAGKKLIVFTNQDDPSPLELENAIVLRPSAYASTLGPNEILIPGLVEDVGKAYGVAVLPKGERPSVGFVGKAGFDTLKARLRYYVRNYLEYKGDRREGTYFRRKAIAYLSRDSRIDVRAILRRRFGAHAKTIELPPEVARKEYIENIQNSLFTLSPRGDGNYSLRFYETLSLGRIPLFIDTDTPLPAADRIPYDTFMVRVPGGDIQKIADTTYEFWNTKSEEELVEMQRTARAVFERELYFPTFIRTLFNSDSFTALLAP
jgi:hypothetical protein